MAYDISGSQSSEEVMIPDLKTMELASIAALVYELRQRIGLSQEKFAAKLGVTFSTVSGWECQKSVPSPLAFSQVREFLKKMDERGAALLECYFSENNTAQVTTYGAK